ncbi:MAG: Lrp/AsnC ligand binding domain [Frankiales bacterium]|jgi:hypothetical protein|nr:Lrp/AsnC ligand binding domain [Frankiales bacterium]
MSIESPARRVFLLLQTDPGRAADAQQFLQGTPGISEIAATSGPFDLIVTAEVAGTAGIERLVGECKRTPGLTRLSRCQSVGA